MPERSKEQLKMTAKNQNRRRQTEKTGNKPS